MIIKNMRINTKISMIFIILIMVIVLCSNAVFYTMVSRVMIDQAIESQNNSIEFNTSNINNLLSNINMAVANLCRDGALVDILNKKLVTPLDYYNGRDVMERLFRQYFIQLMDFISYDFAYFFIDNTFPISEGFFPIDVSSSRNTRNGVFKADTVKNQDWYRDTIERKGVFYCFYLEGDRDHIYIARLVKNPYVNVYSYEKMGVMLISIRTKVFSDYLGTSRLTKNAQVALIDEDRRVVFSSQNELWGKDINENPLISYVYDNKTQKSRITEFNNERYITAISRLKWGLSLISVVPYSDILSVLNTVSNMVGIITGIALAVGIGLTISLSNSISKPIKKLAGVMNSIRSESTIKTQMNYYGDDEVGILYKSFNKMMNRINGLVLEAYESSIRQKTMELKTLQAQINPHFIYNTLDSINWIALCNNQDNIVNMVSSLAAILKYSIKEPDRLALLSEEIEHVKNYAAIQSMRYQDCFDIEYSIPNEYMNLKLPKFILQPLVENSIVHGITKIKHKGVIKISLLMSDGMARLSVCDNGVGADCDELNKYLCGEKASVKDSDGFGIKNIYDRIKINYGGECGLFFKNNDAGLIAEIKIPVQFDDN